MSPTQRKVQQTLNRAGNLKAASAAVSTGTAAEEAAECSVTTAFPLSTLSSSASKLSAALSKADQQAVQVSHFKYSPKEVLTDHFRA